MTTTSTLLALVVISDRDRRPYVTCMANHLRSHSLEMDLWGKRFDEIFVLPHLRRIHRPHQRYSETQRRQFPCSLPFAVTTWQHPTPNADPPSPQHHAFAFSTSLASAPGRWYSPFFGSFPENSRDDCSITVIQHHSDSTFQLRRNGTMSNMPPRMLCAPLRLTAMTLRGIGPYIHGARLEIKPLTILCGENGSGKSTWIEVLRKLKYASNFPVFPFTHLDGEDGLQEHTIDTTCERANLNSVLMYGSAQYPGNDATEVERIRKFRHDLFKSGDFSGYGPPGCIGLEISAPNGHSFDIAKKQQQDPDASVSFAEHFLWSGLLQPGSTLRIRWGQPHLPYDRSTSIEDGIYEWIELAIIHQATPHVLRLSRTNAQPPQRMTFECSESFMGSPETSNDMVERGDVSLSFSTNPAKWELIDVDQTVQPESTALPTCRQFVGLFTQITAKVLEGFFSIGPLRQIHSREFASTTFEATLDEEGLLDPETDAARAIVKPGKRFVGYRGEHTQELYTWWSANLMRQSTEPFTGGIDNQFYQRDFVWGDRYDGYRLEQISSGALLFGPGFSSNAWE